MNGGGTAGGRQPGKLPRVVPGMRAFVTLQPVYSMPFACGDHARLNVKTTTDRARALNQFLAGVEVKAFRIARAALGHDDDALDAVQDSMLQLARAYANRPPEEWRPLFYRILDNRVRDMHRRRTVRARVMAWLPFHREDGDVEADDPIARAES